MPSFFGVGTALCNQSVKSDARHSHQIIPTSKKIFAQLLIFDVSCASIRGYEFYAKGGYQDGNYMEAFSAGTTPQSNWR